MPYETLKYEKEAGYCVITLNRPDRLNAINTLMMKEIDLAVDEAARDPEVKTLVFAGAPRPDGRPCFCAGVDLRENAEQGPYPVQSPVTEFYSQRQPRPALMDAFEKLAWSPKISIAAIDGICTAGGLELALSCDIILVSETAQISDMHVKNLGWIGGSANTGNMALRVGFSKAIELLCTGDAIDGKEAYRIGLANHVYPPAEIIAKAKEMASRIGDMRLAAVMLTKATCMAAHDMDRKSLWRYCDDAFKALMAEPDGDQWGSARWMNAR